MRNELLNRNFNSESGQAVVEYILVLVIAVAIAVGVLYNFNQSVQKYTKALFADYIACLLESGELPGSTTTCSSEAPSFQKLNLPVASASGSGGSGSGTGQTSKSTGSSSRDKNRDRDEASKQKSAETGATSGSVVYHNTLSGSNGDGGQTSAGRGAKGQGGANSLQSSVTRLGRSSPINNSSQEKSKEVLRESAFFAKEEDKKNKERPSIVKLGQSEDSLRPSKSKYKLSDRKPASMNEDTDNLTLADLIRILMIIAILIALVVFFGGQIMNYSRSQEK